MKFDMGPMEKNSKIRPLTWATGYFDDSTFLAYLVSTKSYVLLSDGAGDITEYHVLRRQRSHVILAHVLRSEGTVTAVRSSGTYVLRSQVNRICVGARRRRGKMSKTKPARRHDDGR
jgi:hypothetical protein